MHEEIKNFYLNGEISDGNIVQQRERLVEAVEGQMRDQGYVPALDLDPQFTLDYQVDKSTYKFELTVYGVKIKEGDSWQVAGVTSGRQIMRHTPRPRSNTS